MVSVRRKGFTLIELLTVIAIISILAAITFTALPRVRERARLTKLTGTFKNIETALATYATKPGSSGFPPAYGFLLSSARGKAPNQLTDADYFTRPYGTIIGLEKTADIYDIFGRDADLNNDGVIGLLEYAPIGETAQGSERVTYTNELYRENNVPQEVNEQLQAKDSTIRYVPVNLAQYKKARQYWIDEVKDPLARTWDVNSPFLRNMSFPPPKYDAYVLISVGPRQDTFDVLAEPPQGTPAAYAYHIAALRTYFLASRDLDNDQLLDFDYESSNEERGNKYTVKAADGTVYDVDNLLPSSTMPAGYGPKIWKSR